MPGFDGQSLYIVGRYLLKEIRLNKLNVRGAAVTYNFLMAIPPTLLFLCSLVPYLPVKGVVASILSILHIITPNENAYRTISKIVIDFITHERRDVLSFGILTTLFFSSNGMMGLMRAFDRRLPVYKKRSAFRRRWTAFKLTLLMLLVAIVTIAVLLIQINKINGILQRTFGKGIALKLALPLSSVILILLIFITISAIYRYGASLTERTSFVSPGSVFATLLCVILTKVFFALVNNVIHYNQVYGSIGTLMAFMVWLFLNTQVILLGYEINVSILLAKTAEREETITQNG